MTNHGSNRRATMRDVAQHAGVSIKTVSRVVNDESGVRPVLVERVRKSVRELDYRPDTAARSLRLTGGRTATIALILEDVANPFSAMIGRAVENVAVPKGFMVFSASVDEDPGRERDFVGEFAARRIDGLVIAPTGDDQSYLLPHIAAGTAVVCVDREPRGLTLDTIVSTNTLGASEGVRHLISGGHRRIGFIGDLASIMTAEQRLDGYRMALADAGIPTDPSLVIRDARNEHQSEMAAMRLLTADHPPTALFTAQNLITVGALRALRRLHLNHSVALVGFDDFPLADLLEPGVTVVAQQPTAMGGLAAELLLARITDPATLPGRHLVPTNLIRRGSGEIAAP
ncbi:LacI family DNA-binding transcriptional regulator [Gordonia sp. i37]|uniref:LacI family DNA-binding transcriptional regulator n=1 Tax=Gordonia sp. i37 TaxID=1961707 RepID=UPI0009AD3527|nr:LacI family DNA-binding transcriptional regulator [Gordonia sp. i37]